MNHPAHTLGNGLGGVAATLVGVLTSFQTEFEWWLRCTSLALGIAVAVLTLRNLWKGPQGDE